jgi:hypothetical protein
MSVKYQYHVPGTECSSVQPWRSCWYDLSKHMKASKKPQCFHLTSKVRLVIYCTLCLVPLVFSHIFSEPLPVQRMCSPTGIRESCWPVWSPRIQRSYSLHSHQGDTGGHTRRRRGNGHPEAETQWPCSLALSPACSALQALASR